MPAKISLNLNIQNCKNKEIFHFSPQKYQILKKLQNYRALFVISRNIPNPFDVREANIDFHLKPTREICTFLS
jgi:hypothetical protein